MISKKNNTIKGKIIQMVNQKIEEMIIKEMIIEMVNKIIIILRNNQVKDKDKVKVKKK